MQEATVRLDLHGMNCYQAQTAIDAALRRAGRSVYRIEVVHGYHRGSVLLEVVRTEVRSKRIARRCVTMNPGVTIYYLKEKV